MKRNVFKLIALYPDSTEIKQIQPFNIKLAGQQFEGLDKYVFVKIPTIIDSDIYDKILKELAKLAVKKKKEFILIPDIVEFFELQEVKQANGTGQKKDTNDNN